MTYQFNISVRFISVQVILPSKIKVITFRSNHGLPEVVSCKEMMANIVYYKHLCIVVK